MKLPSISSEKLIKILNKLGFEEIRQKGNHKYFKHPDGRITVVPVHQGRDIGRGLLKKNTQRYRNQQGGISGVYVRIKYLFFSTAR